MSKMDPTDLGTLFDLFGTSFTLAAQPVEFAGGNSTRVLFFAHVEFDGATQLTGIGLALQVSYDRTNWSTVALRKAADDTLLSTKIVPGGGSVQDLALYSDNLRGARYARLVALAEGMSPVAADKLQIQAVFW